MKQKKFKIRNSTLFVYKQQSSMLGFFPTETTTATNTSNTTTTATTSGPPL